MAYPSLGVCQALHSGGQLGIVRSVRCGRALLDRVARRTLLVQLLLRNLRACTDG